VIKGVGEATASKMVAVFGERTLEARVCIISPMLPCLV
jgi:hypothetical protein